MRHDERDGAEGGGRGMLLTAGIVAGLAAGLLLVRRAGGWRRVRRAIARRPRAVAAALDAALAVEGIDPAVRATVVERVVAVLVPSRAGRVPWDADLDEGEADEIVRGAEGAAGDGQAEGADGAAPSPEALEAAVLDAFVSHPILHRRALEIAVDEPGVVQLTGTVRRERDVRLARRVAARVPGVRSVLVDIAVRDGVPVPTAAPD